MTDIIQTGATENISVLVLDGDGVPIPGKTDIKIKMRRISDSKYLDWADMRFKDGPSVSMLLHVLTEINSTYSPGEYQICVDTSLFTNPNANDTYTVVVVQDGGTDAANLPLSDNFVVGSWVDHVGAANAPRIIKG